MSTCPGSMWSGSVPITSPLTSWRTGQREDMASGSSRPGPRSSSVMLHRLSPGRTSTVDGEDGEGASVTAGAPASEGGTGSSGVSADPEPGQPRAGRPGTSGSAPDGAAPRWLGPASAWPGSGSAAGGSGGSLTGSPSAGGDPGPSAGIGDTGFKVAEIAAWPVPRSGAAGSAATAGARTIPVVAVANAAPRVRRRASWGASTLSAPRRARPARLAGPRSRTLEASVQTRARYAHSSTPSAAAATSTAPNRAVSP